MTLAHDEWSNSRRRYEEDDHFPIAPRAIAPLAALSTLPEGALERLDALAIDTTDPKLRYDFFQLLVTHGGKPMQKRLLERACAPGRQAAAHALVFKSRSLDPTVVLAIDVETAATRMPSVAAPLVLVVAHRGSDQFVLEFAQVLADRSTMRKQQVGPALEARRISYLAPSEYRPHIEYSTRSRYLLSSKFWPKIVGPALGPTRALSELRFHQNSSFSGSMKHQIQWNFEPTEIKFLLQVDPYANGNETTAPSYRLTGAEREAAVTPTTIRSSRL
ncbi:hypothetical protein Q4F19_08225 [Sphingomonas sp. BIUV-7]|uniref:Uncharacterized protein n=1 Tax=Sphingomonas natans TaxID=3063330 RepID=A0ABT8Y7T1_9SPHN|nr:hypothetical protein [Sphingomonas sp. BIUV-7]MDO6414364.1 hypothetical protein [Sphingomonas sp. BIUV-7]